MGIEILVGTYVGKRVIDRFQLKKTQHFQDDVHVETGKYLTKVSSKNLITSESDKEGKTNHYLKTSTLSIGLATASYVYPPIIIPALVLASYASIPILQESYKSLSQKKLQNDALNSLVVLSCFSTAHYITASLVAGYYHLADKMVDKTKNHSQGMLTDIFGQQLNTAWITKDNVETEIPLESVQINDIVVISMGQAVPIDGEIVEGMAMIDEHVLTGESMPVEKGEGDQVFASTLMLSGKIWVKVKHTGADTNISKISNMLTHTIDFKTDAQTRAETLANNVAQPLLGVGLLFAPFIGIPAATTILYSSPGNTIKLLNSLQTLTNLTQAYQQGVLVKDGRALENILKVDTVLFDKTGTLTSVQPEIGQIIPLDNFQERDVLIYAAAAEHKLTHPIALAILAKAQEWKLNLPAVENASYKMSYGITVELNGQIVKVGSARFMATEGITIPTIIKDAQEHCDKEGYSLVILAVNHIIKGAIEIHPQIRPEAIEIIQKLRNIYGIKYMAIVSGDREQSTKKLAEKLGMDAYFYDFLPQDKAELIEQFQQEGKTICFIGDGINDAIAMKKSNVSVSMLGATSIATDTAQVVLMNDGLTYLPYLFENAKLLDSKIKRTLLVSGGYSVTNFLGAVFLHATVLFSFLVASGFYILGGIEYAAGTKTRLRDQNEDTDALVLTNDTSNSTEKTESK